MKYRIAYVYAENVPMQPGKVISLRAEGEGDIAAAAAIGAPCGTWKEDHPGMADCCRLTDWHDLTEADLTAIFVRGLKTVDLTSARLCDVPDVERLAAWEAAQEQES
jgi:hypothetical protein